MSRSVRFLAALTAALVLAGCGAEAEGPDPAATEDSGGAAAEQKSEDADRAKETEEKLQDSAGEEEVTVPEDLPVIETRSFAAAQTEFEVDLNAVTATGQVMTVMFTVRNVGDSSQYVNTIFDDGSSSAPLDEGAGQGPGGAQLAYTTDGVTVVDPAEGMMYRAAYDESGHCACSGDLGTLELEPGAVSMLSTSFAAPPEQTETVTVDIPRAGTFENVTLTR